MFGKLNDRAYKVGGCVRDKFLDLPCNDTDYVIQCTEEEFREVFPDAERIGESFPVFIINGNEVALTRTERPGKLRLSNRVDIGIYQDFEITGVGVPLYDDLRRRDFTINSIAQDMDGDHIDPTGGIRDLDRKLIRCVNPQAFMDDPLRIYRGLRFAARFGFQIEEKTRLMMEENARKLSLIKPERVVKELEKVYEQCPKPSAFFRELFLIGGLSVHFDQLTDLTIVPAGPAQYHGENTAFDHTMEVIDRCKEAGLSFDCFIACLVHDFGKGTTKPEILPHHYGHEERSEEIAFEWFRKHRFSARTQKLALCVARKHMQLHWIEEMRLTKAVEFYRGVPRDLKTEFLACCDCDHTLTEAQAELWFEIERAVKATEIPNPIPKGTHDPHRFITGLYVKKIREMRKEQCS